MQYLALLISQERDLTPEQGATEMAAYQSFHAKAASAIRGGDALLPAATGVRISGGPDAPTITDGPFAESAEVAGGYYVFEAENLDDALHSRATFPPPNTAPSRFARSTTPSIPSGREPMASGWRCCWNRPERPMSPARRNGRRKRRDTVNSLLSQAITSSPGPHCTSRRRQRRCGFATAMCC